MSNRVLGMNIEEEFDRIQKEGKTRHLVYMKKTMIKGKAHGALTFYPDVSLPPGIFECVRFNLASKTAVFYVILPNSRHRPNLKGRRRVIPYAVVELPNKTPKLYLTKTAVRVELNRLHELKTAHIEPTVKVNKLYLEKLKQTQWAGIEPPIGTYFYIRQCRDERVVYVGVTLNGQSAVSVPKNTTQKTVAWFEEKGNFNKSIIKLSTKEDLVEHFKDLLSRRKAKSPELESKYYEFKVDGQVVSV